MKESSEESPNLNRLALAARAGCAVVILVAGCVFLGWALDVERLRRILPFGRPINPLSALTFIGAGVSLWRRVELNPRGLRTEAPAERPPLDLLAAILALGVVVVGAIKLGGNIFHGGFRIDYLLFPTSMSRQSFGPAGMSPNSALGFVLCGLGLLLFDVESHHEFRPAQALVLTAGLISLIALIGYTYGVARLYDIGSGVPMSLSSAVLFALFTLSFLAAAPRQGLMLVVASEQEGGAIARRLLPVALIAPWVLGAFLLEGVKRNYYERELAVSIFAVLSTIIFTGMSWWNAKLLYLAELERAGAERRLTAQHHCARILATAPNWSIAAPRVLESLGQALGWDAAAFWQAGPTGPHLQCAAVWGADERARKFVEEICALQLPRDLDLPGRVWTTRQTVWMADVTGDNNFTRRNAAAAAGLRTAVGFPLRLGGEFFGMVELFRREPALPDTTLMDALAGIGEQISQFIERTRAEEQLRQTSANLARSNTDLEQFAYVASHDLVEPLRMVTSYLELLSDRYKSKLDSQAQEFIGYAVDSARRMRALIHDLLEYSRLDTRGRSFEVVNGEEILQAALSNLKVALEESGAQVTHGPLPRVFGDKVQLTQVLQNLIGNALKFHGATPPHIHVQAESSEAEWVFSVRDNGIGIDPKDFERIFILFQRLHTRREYSGTGMGLAIVKKIVERHGGRIWVQSTPGQGATFYFSLPRGREV